MSSLFRFEMLAVAIIFTIFVIRLINKNKISLKRTAGLIVLAIVMFLFSIFPGIAELLTEVFGFETTSNFLYFCAILYLLVNSIFQGILLSNCENKIKNLIQEVSIIKSSEGREKR
jgi:hypothetical protein